MNTAARPLFNEGNNYASTSFPPPRPFQDTAHEALRQGFRDGNKNQLIMAPTGAGKSFLAMRIAQEALVKNRRVTFVCDRTTLINQTSAVADQYGLAAHGIVQAQHWRRDTSLPFQIASVQTIAKRGFWPESDVIIVDECFPGDVEVLTENGFVRFDALEEGVKCAQFDDGEIVFVEPTAYIKKPYKGDLVSIKSDALCDLAMTPSHELLMFGGKDKSKKVSARDAVFNHNWSMAAAGKASGTDDELTSIERFLIALQAYGSIHHRDGAESGSYSFTFAKQRKIERLTQIVGSCGFSMSEVKCTRNRRRFIVHGAPIISKRVWEHFDLKSMSHAKAKKIIEEMVEWDGSKSSATCWYFSSVVKEATDFYQCVAILAGFKTRVTVQADDRSDSFSDIHRLFIQIMTSTFGTQRLKKQNTPFDGTVHCIRVPSGNIVVRRNGMPVVTGNCHTQYSTWTEYAMNTKAVVIGLSATPFSPGLGRIFTNLINATNMHDLTESGVLVPMRVLSCTQINMNGAETRGGEWTDGAAGARGMEIVGDVVAEWLKFGEGRKTIVFGSTIAHCQEMAAKFAEAGIMAAVFTSETTADEREILLKEYTKVDSALRVLISVEALAKGFDVPDVSCVVDCRPLRKSLSTAIQMWGRGLRSSPATGKKDCILLDHSGNIRRFKEDFEDIYFNGLDALDTGEKLDKKVRQDDQEKEANGCPSCGFRPFHKRCMSCGFELQVRSLVEPVAGEMREIIIGKKKLADDSFHLYQQLCTYARAHSAPEKQRARAAHLFEKITGQRPPATFNFFTTDNAPITRNVQNKITNLNIAYRRAMEKVAA